MMSAADMNGVTFPAWGAGNPIELSVVLELLGDRGRESSWRLRNVEVAPSKTSDRLHALSEQGEAASGEELFRLAAEKPQIIDGELEGTLPDADEPWVCIRAVDSTSWDILSHDEALLDRARTTFGAIPLP